MEKTQAVERLDEVPVTGLRGVGPKVAERLARLGVRTLQDLLFHLPLHYQDRTRIVPISELRQGDEVQIEGIVRSSEVALGRRRSLRVLVEDDSGTIGLRFFHFSRGQANALNPGSRLRAYGEVRDGPKGPQMIHPEYTCLSGGENAPPVESMLTPVYPSTEGMQQLSLRGLTQQALDWLQRVPDALPDWMPPEVSQRYGLPDLTSALWLLHRPPKETDLRALQEGRHAAVRRLVFEEMVAHQLSLRRMRHFQQRMVAPPLSGDGGLRRRLLANLPFDLTAAQRRVVGEIDADLERDHPMQRMLQGDVGSGKTVVAALAVLQALEADHQAVLMAPTELLSEQHQRSFRAWLEPLDQSLVWLTGRHKGRERAAHLAEIISGKARMVVGTHALFQEDVSFQNLGLAIIDEQHRFGVHQRLRLHEKGKVNGRAPHQLIMTATPIPRSLAMTCYADLDLSVIDEVPPGRTPVKTAVVADTRRQEVIERVRAACRGGRQAYWVCTLIEESEALECTAAEDTAAGLRQSLPELGVGLVHGRLKATEKERRMQRFQAGELDLLVATTVIEVGVDVPNASLMIVENPERLGLAQLHQLRGRVGRGTIESHCVLLYHAPLSRTAKDRLRILRNSTSGFEIAQKDLELRGPGEVLGTRQTGEMQFRIADLVRDQALLSPVQQAADLLLDRYPRRVEPLIRRWLGAKAQYGRV